MPKSIHNVPFMFAVSVVALVLILGLGGEQATAQSTKTLPQHGSTAVVDIVRNPAEVPPPVGNREATTVKVELVAKEVVGELDPAAGTSYRYWTFNGKVPRANDSRSPGRHGAGHGAQRRFQPLGAFSRFPRSPGTRWRRGVVPSHARTGKDVHV